MLKLGKWDTLRKHFAPSAGKKGIVKVSGGRTSAMMAALTTPDTLKEQERLYYGEWPDEPLT